MNITGKLKHPIITTLLLAIAVSGAIIYGTLKWLDSYTLHNKAVIVPDVKGLPMAEAALLLRSSGLRYNIIDSVFSKNVRPGSIVEVVPAIGSKVKEGRIVFVTVNASTSEMAAIPAIRDKSYRQAEALLRASGFESITIESVPGAYKDLAVGIEFRGRMLEEGERVQLAAPLILKVSDGVMLKEDSPTDTEAPENPIESWF